MISGVIVPFALTVGFAIGLGCACFHNREDLQRLRMLSRMAHLLEAENRRLRARPPTAIIPRPAKLVQRTPPNCAVADTWERVS